MPQGGHINQTVLLSGSKAFTLAETASVVSSVLDRPLALRTASADEYVSKHKNVSPADDAKNPRGEEAFLRQWATTYPALERGECAVVDPLLSDLLGRELVPFEQTVREVLKTEGYEALGRYAK